MRELFICLAMLLAGVSAAGQETVSGPECIIPKVASSQVGKGSFVLSKGASFAVALFKKASVSESDLKTFRGYLTACELSLVEAPGKKADIRFEIGPVRDLASEEAYDLTITPKGITVKASALAGAFYALQSIIQMYSVSPAIMACHIADAPHFAYRGLMFDVVRHFHSKDFVLKQLDVMALLKMNRFHFHLTDNEGWRIALDCAPEMTEFGAFGDSGFYHNLMSRQPLPFARTPKDYVPGTVYDDGKIYGGYYSKDNIREIIAYAAARHITIVPEIELPGHNKALLAVHPEFFCDGEHRVDNVICAGSDDPLRFFKNVLEEVMNLFPSEYIHIGGDEASKENWKLCSRCRARMASEGLIDEFELQSSIIRKVEKIINARGKHLIGWDEILEGGLSENATVMSWRGTGGGLKSVRMNHDVIMTPNTYYYLDYCQDAPQKEPLAFNSYLPLKHVYGYNPEDEIIKQCGADADPSILKHLLGVQGNLWGECIIDSGHYEYMLYPRAFAIAETGWTPAEIKDFVSFRKNALALSKWLSAKGYKVFDLTTEAGERPEALVKTVNLTEGAQATWRIGGREPEEASILVDGYRGGWNTKDENAWKRVRRAEMSVDIDLGSVKEIHYIGVEFIDYGIRRFRVPEDTEFFVSDDGISFRQVDIPQARLSRVRKPFMIYTVGSTVCEKARFIRLRYNHSSKKVDSFIGEIIIN